MAKEQTTIDSHVLRAFHAYEEGARIANTKIGCILVVTLMPAGVLLDRFVYPNHVGAFSSSESLAPFWLLSSGGFSRLNSGGG